MLDGGIGYKSINIQVSATWQSQHWHCNLWYCHQNNFWAFPIIYYLEANIYTVYTFDPWDRTHLHLARCHHNHTLQSRNQVTRQSVDTSSIIICPYLEVNIYSSCMFLPPHRTGQHWDSGHHTHSLLGDTDTGYRWSCWGSCHRSHNHILDIFIRDSWKNVFLPSLRHLHCLQVSPASQKSSGNGEFGSQSQPGAKHLQSLHLKFVGHSSSGLMEFSSQSHPTST